ncbi:hypothetical protein COW36_09520 [bacterium (Candidatus Blackallbacteria) CG17_big_fil_post_rev_8_21_14_2_50_48_46]|uniref:Lipoyl-binding domain-containing protein n=1 Tax=bacterium (Candidatus Blackallbacteria) CG17_big_fil_post_rev_8_21_14_2_50_48_46 TaxID=2014261 RepID=A0A2M7G5D5_9BACT|nr:MAG: hypothetical protein COW64_01890 [bacterium (Candidatus Blackallbacteria) CG18_big_fil_WC_8_21_14_2_50_49_26]PIW17201.1 MAG: hypothetical protein COW36_09520 [bacterium (Candidatus Blackallbacteria) CG17_big_fil_post_rev_8_21_14_2_50_48_46]PIW50992.1 MAG: hypothetical protein COW20_00530 [bacterium (Candidatus Blackallbacteria) CG13_big_fil_rev_8_21_14_2_50_49_14]
MKTSDFKLFNQIKVSDTWLRLEFLWKNQAESVLYCQQRQQFLWQGQILERELETSLLKAVSPHSGSEILAPMAGKVTEIFISEDRQISANETLLYLEAMKMRIEIKAPRAALVSKLLVKEGDQVELAQLLVKLKT